MLDVLVNAKGAGIAGTVVDEERKPVPNAAVVTVPSTGKLGRPDAYQFAVSDESGHFAVRGMNPGGFQVLAFQEMRENYRLPEFAKRDEGKGQKVELEQGGRKSVVVKLITQEAERPWQLGETIFAAVPATEQCGEDPQTVARIRPQI